MPEPTPILFWGDRLGFHGGIERYAFQAASLLRRNGFRVDYAGAMPDRQQHAFQEGFDRIVPPDEEAFAPYRMVAIHKLPDAETLRRLVRIFPGKLVLWAHDHDAYCPRHHYYTPFRRTNCHRAFSPLPCIPCALATHPGRWSAELLRFSERLRCLRRLPAVVLSQFMADNLRRNGFDPENIHLVNPFLSPTPPPPDENAPAGEAGRLLFIGQLIRGKGCDLLLQALARLPKRIALTVVGDGKDRDFLERLAERLKLTERIRFAGWSTEPEAFFTHATLAVFPSRWQEPFGLVGLESLAHGMPVVAFDVGGVRQWLKPGVNGLLVPPGDIPALARAIRSLIDNPTLRRQLARNAWTTAREDFSEDNFLRDVRRLMNSIDAP